MKNSCVEVIDFLAEEEDGLDCFAPEAKADSPSRPRRPALQGRAPRGHRSRAVYGRRRELRFWQRSPAFGWSLLLSAFVSGLLVGAMLTRPAIPPATPIFETPVKRLALASSTPTAAPPVVVLDERRGTAGSEVAQAVDADAPRGAEATAAQPSRPAVPQHRGTLIVTSIPRGAAVYLNDEYAGETPLTMRGVASGSRAVRVALDGYASWSRGVQVVAGEATTVSATLNELSRAQ